LKILKIFLRLLKFLKLLKTPEILKPKENFFENSWKIFCRSIRIFLNRLHFNNSEAPCKMVGHFVPYFLILKIEGCQFWIQNFTYRNLMICFFQICMCSKRFFYMKPSIFFEKLSDYLFFLYFYRIFLIIISAFFGNI
jgi:hypothetical protein